MKKMFLIVTLATMMSTSAFALVGKVGVVKVDTTGAMTLSMIRDDLSKTSPFPLIGTDLKSMFAMLLTAKSADIDVDVTLQTVDGVRGWTSISIP